jgi:hypothetical protein
MRSHTPVRRWPSAATATALLALFISCGGVAVAGTMINGSSIKLHTIPGDRLVLHTVTRGQMRIPPEQLVGAAGEPAFGSGWKNAGGGFQSVGFYRDDEGAVHLRGVVALGGHVTTIFTLPIGYRPAATEMFSAGLDNAGAAMIEVTAFGAVDLEFINSPDTPDSMTLSQISFRAGP